MASAVTLRHIADLLAEADRVQQTVMDGAECNRIHTILADLVEQFDELADEEERKALLTFTPNAV